MSVSTDTDNIINCMWLILMDWYKILTRFFYSQISISLYDRVIDNDNDCDDV